MPDNLKHFQQTRQLHFLTFSCYHRKPLLGSESARDLFESALERIRTPYEWAILGYVVMPEHVHLLVSEPRIGSLAVATQALKLSITKRQSVTPFWQARYTTSHCAS